MATTVLAGVKGMVVATIIVGTTAEILTATTVIILLIIIIVAAWTEILACIHVVHANPFVGMDHSRCAATQRSIPW